MSGYEKTECSKDSSSTGLNYESLVMRIEQLTQMEQLILSLRFEQSLNPHEIAAVMDLDVGDIKRILHNCIADLLERDDVCDL
jgi:DNA-directed RNA polymerase specialized sigma subunit